LINKLRLPARKVPQKLHLLAAQRIGFAGLAYTVAGAVADDQRALGGKRCLLTGAQLRREERSLPVKERTLAWRLVNPVSRSAPGQQTGNDRWSALECGTLEAPSAALTG